MAKNTNPVIDVARDYIDAHDPWGSALNLCFDICETLVRHGVPVPTDWEYSPGAFTGEGELDEDNDSPFCFELDFYMRHGHVSNILHAGEVLSRYVRILELAGKSY